MAYTYAGHYGPEALLAVAADKTTRAFTSGTVNVYTVGTTTPVTLYTDRTKGTTAANPVSADAKGNVSFYVDPGQYDIVFTPDGGLERLTVTVAADPSEASATYVPIANSIATGTYEDILAWHIASDANTARAGIFGGSENLVGGLGYAAGVGNLDTGPSTGGAVWQVERHAKYAVGAHAMSEGYLQVQTVNTDPRFPISARYDENLSQCIDSWAMIGSGVDPNGNVGGNGFSVRWDDAGSQIGTAMFKMTPNRLDIIPITTGGIAADKTRIRMYSVTGHGSSIGLSYNGADPEGNAGSTWSLETVGDTQTNLVCKGTLIGAFYQPSSTQGGLDLYSGLGIGNGAGGLGGRMWSGSGAPGAIGGNGDFYFRTDGGAGTAIYQKRAGVWVATAA